jgi:hypothetical protein
MRLLEPIIHAPHANLAAFNIEAIRAIVASLSISSRFLRQSELAHSGRSNALLASLVGAAGGNAYLLGGGADEYHDHTVFEAAGIQVIPQNFQPAPYGPPERFIPGLSVIDYLMHDGRPLGRAEKSDG